MLFALRLLRQVQCDPGVLLHELLSRRGVGDVRVEVPLREDPLVEVEHHRVLLRELPVEHALHVAVRAEGLLDVALPPVLGAQLDRLEPVDVLAVEEHESDDGAALVRLERMAGEDGALDDESVGVDREEGSRANDLLTAIGGLLKTVETCQHKGTCEDLPKNVPGPTHSYVILAQQQH